jgi:hypothetical protein
MNREAQHAWEATYASDGLGRPLPPRFHRLVMFDLMRTPRPADAARLEHALRRLEESHPHGPDGLLMLLAWGPGYFARHTNIPAPVPRPVALARDEHAVLEDIDACLHIASDDEDRLDDTLSALLHDGELRLSDPLRVREVRTGCVGAGLPARRAGAPVPADSPLLLGFHSGLRRNQATEAEITITSGPLAGGTTMHVSRIALDLGDWYALRGEQRAALMYAPTVTPRQAAAFADDAPADFERLPETAHRYGIVGHAQAAARARLDGRPRLNRRDFVTFDDGVPGTHFVSLQRDLEDFNATRAVMNAADGPHHHRAVGLRANNGINAFMEVMSRATFGVPPRSRRAFPGMPFRRHGSQRRRDHPLPHGSSAGRHHG